MLPSKPQGHDGRKRAAMGDPGSSGDHQPFKAAASNPLGADQLVKAEQTEEANPTGIIAVPGQQIVQVNVKAEEDDKLGVALRVIAALEARIQALEGRVQALELAAPVPAPPPPPAPVPAPPPVDLWQDYEDRLVQHLRERRHGDKPVTLSELGQRVPRPHGVDKVGAFCAERHNIFEVDGPYVFLVEDDIA